MCVVKLEAYQIDGTSLFYRVINAIPRYRLRKSVTSLWGVCPRNGSVPCCIFSFCCVFCIKNTEERGSRFLRRPSFLIEAHSETPEEINFFSFLHLETRIRLPHYCVPTASSQYY